VTDGLVVVDKPAGWTSHDVVARVRRLAGTRRVGHAGTLDPMATGVLVVGIERATRLLGHLALHDKDYDATIRLGVTTTTDDAEGDVVATCATDGITDAAIAEAVERLTGDIEQVPSAVSAVKVAGERAYAKVRRGEQVALEPRKVHVARFDVVDRRRSDLDVRVTVSSGTYVRALARDLGRELGVGGHLTALRRTRVGGFTLDRARTLDMLAASLEVVPLSDAVAAAFPRVDVAEDVVRAISFGQRFALMDAPAAPVVGVFAPDGDVVALADTTGASPKSLVVFRPAG
jgi:tRNA pseudouridine55 synthase